MPRFSPFGFSGPSRCLIPSPRLASEYPLCAVCVCVCVEVGLGISRTNTDSQWMCCILTSKLIRLAEPMTQKQIPNPHFEN